MEVREEKAERNASPLVTEGTLFPGRNKNGTKSRQRVIISTLILEEGTVTRADAWPVINRGSDPTSSFTMLFESETLVSASLLLISEIFVNAKYLPLTLRVNCCRVKRRSHFRTFEFVLPGQS